jgi:hypothetical protein
MPLDPAKLSQIRDRPGGGFQARCPACAEDGHDKDGTHLWVKADGRFGCCVHPKDTGHRKRIWKLAGKSERRALSVQLPTLKPLATVRIHRAGLAEFMTRSAKQPEPATSADEQMKTPPQPTTPESDGMVTDDLFAGRPGRVSQSLARTRGRTRTCVQGLEEPVRAVRAQSRPILPHLTGAGDLVIPFDAPERYQWWKGGQSIAQTRAELAARKENDGSAF